MGAIALVGERHLDGVPENDSGLNLLRLSAAKMAANKKQFTPNSNNSIRKVVMTVKRQNTLLIFCRHVER